MNAWQRAEIWKEEKIPGISRSICIETWTEFEEYQCSLDERVYNRIKNNFDKKQESGNGPTAQIALGNALKALGITDFEEE